jgi:hypothetical protein
MRTPDDMIRAATRQTAAEISPQSVPALRLPSSPQHGRRGPARNSGPPGRPGWRRLAAPLGAAAAVIAIIAATVAVTGAEAGGHAPNARRHVTSSRSRGVSLSPSVSSRIDQEVIDSFVPATGAQYTDGSELQATSVAACMTHSGFAVPRTWAASFAAAFFDNTQLPDLDRISRTRSVGTASLVRISSSSPAKRRAIDTYLARCQNAVTRALRPVEKAGGILADPWWNIVTRIQGSAPVRATVGELRSCADRYGAPAEPYGAPPATINSFSDFVGWVASYLDGAGSRGLSTTQLNRHWARVFVRCGRITVAVQQQLQSARRTVFLRQHRRQVLAVEALARQAIVGLDRQYRGAGAG